MLATNARPNILLAVASNIEAERIRAGVGAPAPTAPRPQVGSSPWSIERLAPGVDMVVTGVGKVNAAAGVASTLNPSHAGVISIGIAGILPAQSIEASICDVVVATAMRYPDEGKESPDGYQSLAAMGFAHGPFDEGFGLAATPQWTRILHSGLALAAASMAQPGSKQAPKVHQGVIATVSTCSATDALARQVAQRTGAIAEGMEGAAACQVAAWHGLAFAEVRVLSNTTGDRNRQQWNMRDSLAVLGCVARAMCI